VPKKIAELKLQMTDIKGITKVLKSGFFGLLVAFLTIWAVPASAQHENEEHSGEHSEHATTEADQHGEEHAEEEGWKIGEWIMHHVSDAHQIHFWTTNPNTPEESHVAMALPIILWTDNGLEVFSSSHFYHNSAHTVDGHVYLHDGYVMTHDEKIYYANNDGSIQKEEVTVTEKVDGEEVEKTEMVPVGPLDISITKSVVGLFITGLLCVLLFSAVARGYKKRGKAAPKGIQSLLEPLILFVRDEVAIPSIGAKKADKFMPFLMTIFFFIWMANMLGLIPFIGGFNVMGTMSVTIVLALIVFIITTINGNRHYWTHLAWPPGVPLPIKFILVPIELLGIFIKPAVLMVRLTANITAGHIIILAFTGLIFIFGSDPITLAPNWGAGIGMAVGSTLFMVFMFFIELLVAFLQAYVFTLLSALYFGSAVEEAHH
jgi:F-type H+-transporting ATPase subunit a